MSTAPNYIALLVDEDGSAQVTGDLGLSLSQGSFSLSAWVHYDAFSSNAQIVHREGEFSLYAIDNGFAFQISGRPPVVWQSSDDLQSTWYHVCVTYDSGTARLYIDGDFKQLASVGSAQTTASQPLVVGAGLQGLVFNVIVYNRTLAAAEVLDAQYADLDASLIAAHFDFSQNPPVGKGPKTLPIALTDGAQPVTVTPGLHLRSTAYAYPMHDEAINPGGGYNDPYSVQAWVYVERTLPTQHIFANCDLDWNTGMALKLTYDAAHSQFVLVSERGTGESAQVLTSSAPVPANAWVNVATTFDGTTLTVYVDGTAAGTLACDPLPLSRPYGDIVIGGTFSETGNGGVETLQGFLSRVEVWNVALTAAQVVQFQGQLPSPTTTGLVGGFDLTTSPARNNVNGHPVGLADGALVYHMIAPAPLSVERRPVRPVVLQDHRFGDGGGTDEVSAAKLSEWRSSVDHSAFLKEYGDAIDAACTADMADFADEASKEKIRAAYEDVKRRLAGGVHPDMPLAFTRHEEDGRRYLVAHGRHGSYVAYVADAAEVDDCTLWKIQLLFIVVAGALDAVFGVSARLSSDGRTILTRLLNNPTIAAFMAEGTAIKASTIFLIVSAIYTAGLLRPLIWAIVNLGLWALFRLIAKALLTFAGVGAADTIASLAATAVLFIKTYAEKPASCTPLPQVTLAAIQFNYDPTQAATDALSLRVNNAGQVDVPEWRKGYTSASQSPAAYAIDKVSGKTVTVRAKFTIDTSDDTSMQIQATGGGILGAIDPVTVHFKSGVSSPQYVTLSLPHHQLAAGGVQAVDAAWTWQYKPGSSWTTMDTTKHRIYTLLSVPTMPWIQSPDPLRTQLPWTAALEYACPWASGKTDAAGVLSAVTQNIFSGYGLKYDTSHGASFYTTRTGEFLLTKFLEKLGGGTGNGNIVNCTDCATIVATFANLLGCNVQASVMGIPGKGFDCNSIIAIGFTDWAPPFPSGGVGHFNYHEVVWTAGSGVYDHIYDACLKLDGGNNPWDWSSGTSHTAVQPENFQFTSQPLPTTLPISTPFTDQTYRERLATNTANGIGECMPVGQWPNTQSGRRKVV